MNFNNFCVIILLLFTRFTCFSSDKFSKFDSIVFVTSNPKVLEIFSKEELRKFQSTKDVYYLYNSKYVDAYIEGLKGNNNERLKILNWIIEDGNELHTEQITYVYYHLASLLSVMNSPKLSQEYAFIAMNNSIEYSYKNMLFLNYTLVGSNFYKNKQFKKANVYYEKSLNLIKNNPSIQSASMMNNIGLCQLNLKEYLQAKNHFIKAINVLNNIDRKSKDNLHFLNVVQGNLGTVLNQLGNYEESIVLLENEIKYYFMNKEYLKEAIPPVIELLKLYNILGRTKECKTILMKVIYLEDKFSSQENAYLLTESLYSYYINKRDNFNALKYSDRLIKIQKGYTNSIIKQSSELNEIIYRNKIQHLNEDKKSQEILLKLTLNEKRSNQILFFTIVSLGFFIVFVAYRSKKKSRLQDDFIQNQNKLLLENENKLQQEKITNLAINLTLKKNTEKAFLAKINELKKKNNSGVEQVIKDLQFSVSNLLNIDKKLIHSTIEADDIHHDFKISIAKLHPELTKTDITFCCYFRLNLSAKEISALQGVSDGSVRVIKNRIKNKLNLLPENSINDYLIHI